MLVRKRYSARRGRCVRRSRLMESEFVKRKSGILSISWTHTTVVVNAITIGKLIKMEKAHLRKLRHSNQCELVFPLRILNENLEVIVEAEIRAVRSCTDVIESLLAHTERKVTKILRTRNIQNINVQTSLTVNDINVKGDINCKDFIDNPKKNIVFSIINQQFEVVLNAPLIQELALPKTIHVNYEFQPIKCKSIYTDKDLCDFIWYSSLDGQSWVEIGNKFKYKPTINDLNKYLKLKCVPKNRDEEGPPFVVVSQSTVLEMSQVPVCPFDDRHTYTKTFLTDKKQIRIVSYNILSNLYAENGNDVTYCSPQALSIDYRKQLILKEILGYNADIICLQEVDLHIFSWYLKPKLLKMYKGLFHRKGYKISEGLTCFVNVERFNVLESNQVVFGNEVETNPLFKRTWRLIQKCDILKDTLTRQKTSLQITVLQSRNANEIVIVANTHLYYHSKASQIRLLQASIALDYINDVYKRYNRISKYRVSVLFCGDFNSVPSSPTYEFITNGNFKNVFQDDNETVIPMHFNHPFQFASACGTPEYTNYTVDFKGCLDYIFYDKNNFKVIDYVPLPEESLLAERTALPNEVFPSDHLALVCDLGWT
ncbi:hypothetical protein RN001_007468 [Aquatica leii]|uniref:Endonuclease/exonuclease/phosphatase domain-containing protein n=1 Tax=Aquatica leii TaxID=1421715 RepID=A0AAN7PY66_9COLE|nr:hypothetical protein RN001_007468 [Aquatica leii]